jgi:hypothetical protein
MEVYNYVSHFKDLGIIFDTKLNFSLHSEIIKKKAKRILVFFKRTFGLFSDPIPLKLFYCSLSGSNLENCLFVWLKNTIKQSKILRICSK